MDRSQRTKRAEEMRAVLTEHADSGQSLAAFARARGMAPQTLYYWNRKLQPGTSLAGPVERRPRLAPVRLIAEPSSLPRVEIELRSGHRLRLYAGFEAAELPHLVAILESC